MLSQVCAAKALDVGDALVVFVLASYEYVIFTNAANKFTSFLFD